MSDDHEELGRKYPITLVAYDSAWPARFEREARRLREALPGAARRMEHFGSTAVPGLAAKPVIDILLEVASLHEAEGEVAARLAEVGYIAVRREDRPDPYMMFVRGYGEMGYLPDVQRVHCHAGPLDHRLWKRLRFCAWLRTHPEDAAAYEALKRDLARRHRNDREAYTDAKGAFVTEIMRKAGAAA